MIKLSVGCNFDPELLVSIPLLNNISTRVRIGELYGSDQSCHWLTARPKYRLVPIDDVALERYVGDIRSMGLSFNYTMNAPYIGSKREIRMRKKNIQERIRFLSDIGCDMITISHPIIAEMIREADIPVKIAVSTIMHLDTVSQLKILHERYHIDKLYNNLLKNRSIKFLMNLSKFCSDEGIELTLLANEFCNSSTMDGATSTHCIYRDSCYLFHSENEDKEDDELLRGYPMSHCISMRQSVLPWLKAPFIRPEDLYKYECIGVNSFKITGRTGTTEYLLAIVEAYIREYWMGNLLSLWKPLETIANKGNELNYKYPVFIDNRSLDTFIDFWFDNPWHDCANELCGYTCKYCKRYFLKHLGTI